jgi:ketosteroid isomerase-like protein
MRAPPAARSFAAMDDMSTVQRIYEAFGRGDVDAILAELDEDVAWEDWASHSAQEAGVPWLARREGRAAAAGFFAALGELEQHRLEPVNFLAGGGEVAVTFRVDLTVRATGRRFQDEEIHLWTFGPDGRVTRFRHYGDTAKHIAASRQPVSA